jgi:hypothetical protein
MASHNLFRGRCDVVMEVRAVFLNLNSIRHGSKWHERGTE